MAGRTEIIPMRTRNRTWRVRAMCNGDLLIDRTFVSYENALRAARWATARRDELLGDAQIADAAHAVFRAKRSLR